jgi:hypothetical protein
MVRIEGHAPAQKQLRKAGVSVDTESSIKSNWPIK